ncbi:SMU1112c/YaeR family gloxylase I-like metalloprotein [Domibacillus indicus]|uniref:SMU1112c/YaeR family gloxylase I-like metalloprotein n=1 Tax=Domibacillus indicus TaxID=1437523 RepID=UPI000617F147|nr:VOC family protein [Domibacillus indicus]
MELTRIHHVAIICSNYEQSKRFYTEVLGLEVLGETYRADRDSYKLDLQVGGIYQIELFSFRDAPERPSYPEARGLRHIAFEVESIAEAVRELERKEIEVEPVRIDPVTGKAFAFFADPDGLPIELYEK